MAGMKKDRVLPRDFFQKNPLEPKSAAIIAHYFITRQQDTSFRDMMREVFESRASEEEKEKAAADRKAIEGTENAADLVELLRKGCEKVNEIFLCDKILAQQAQAMPLMLRRYCTSGMDRFIEAATMVFVAGEKQYAQQLLQIYSAIRNPYAQACACLVFGVQGMKEALPLLYQEYERLGQIDSDDDFEQYPLLALYLLCNKF